MSIIKPICHSCAKQMLTAHQEVVQNGGTKLRWWNQRKAWKDSKLYAHASQRLPHVGNGNSMPQTCVREKAQQWSVWNILFKFSLRTVHTKHHWPLHQLNYRSRKTTLWAACLQHKYHTHPHLLQVLPFHC
jgi:hypothetical protein